MHSQVALIPGGARGIGRAVALALARQGWRVAICYRSSMREARATCDEVANAGGSAWMGAYDVSKPVDASALVHEVNQHWGGVDALIHCAGPYHRIPLLDESVEGWLSMFADNLHSLFYLGRAVAPGMQQRGWGRIISFSIATADQQIGQTHITAHYAAKAGVLILTRSLAKVLAGQNITANTISPGFIDSAELDPNEPKALELARMKRNIPAGYIGSTQDAVAVVLFLLSDGARYVNGANIHVSGAWGI